MPDPDEATFASKSLGAHLLRGGIGFGLIAAALALTASLGAVALLLAPAGLLALRGCPMCWTIGLIETISAGRVRKACSGTGCAIDRPVDRA
jgi:hypothetical protein